MTTDPLERAMDVAAWIVLAGIADATIANTAVLYLIKP